jgi:5-methyltetrahydrofolate--homocysteine methyltransferase
MVTGAPVSEEERILSSSASIEELLAAITEIREEDALAVVDDLLANGTEPQAVIDSCREAMTIIGQRFEAGDAFIPELIMAGEIMTGICAKVKPHLSSSHGTGGVGRVVLGTVKGDIHDIGKDIVGSILEASGFDVLDLGVDVAPERFVDAVRGEGVCTIALSCLLTTGFDSMKATVAAIEGAGLRPQARIMVGGAPITEDVCAYTGADGWGDDAATALRLAAEWADRGAS